jgi:hypothetical protein
MKKLVGFLIIALTLSVQSMAFGQDDAPPFSTMVCESGNVSVQVKIQHYRQTYGAGPASINGNGTAWSGGWYWKAAPEGTRLTGFHFLDVKANDLNGSGPFYLKTLYNGIDLSEGGWLDMSGFSGPVNCKINKVEAEQKLCKVPPQNNCSVSPKRWCCVCDNGQLSCY